MKSMTALLFTTALFLNACNAPSPAEDAATVAPTPLNEVTGISEPAEDRPDEMIHDAVAEVSSGTHDLAPALPTVSPKPAKADPAPEPAPEVAPLAEGTTPPPTPAGFDHSAWDALLKDHVSNTGLVDYGGFAKDPRFTQYLAQLSAAKGIDTWSRNERIAFWVNVYNAFTIQLINDHPTVKSIKDISDPWKKKFFSIGGQQMNLDQVEHIELREKLGDERIHFAIVCASFSCPQLWNRAFTAAGLDKQLDDAARRFINDPLRNQLGAKPKLSRIFDWFKGDFTKEGGLVDYINRYAATPLPAKASIAHLDYDWKLNGTR